MSRQILTLFFVLAFISTVSAVIEQDNLTVFAVTNNDETALSAGLSLTIKPGTGKIWSSVEPLIGTSTQTTEKIAVKVAENYFKRTNKFDYFFEIESTASLVDGPSAGAAMGLLTIAMLQNKEVPENISVTGTITVDGGVGAVGGVFKKAQKAAATGIDLFMIPRGEAKQIVKLPGGVESINLSEYARDEWGITVVEVSNMDDVVKYAFSDIETIDVSTQAVFTPDFVPEVISFPLELEPMHIVTSDYIKKAELGISKARKALGGTLLTDPSMVDAMLSLLNESEKTLEQAKLLHDHNYLYSAANYSFLAKVNASLVRDISDNPSLLSGNSTVWDIKLLNLKKDLESMKRDLNTPLSVDSIEWYISARQRLNWAEEKIETLLGDSDTIVITVGSEEDEMKALEKLRDFEYASAWLEAARDFYAISLSTDRLVTQDTHFDTQLDTYLVNVENALTMLTDEEKDDILRRYSSAKLAKEKRWTASALFDAVSAFALADSSIYIKNRSLEELDDELKLRIESLQQEMNEDERPSVWPRLYLDHASYYSKGVDFYRSQNENSRALEMVKSGVSLVFLAESMFNVTQETKTYFNSLPPERYFSASTPAVFGDEGFVTEFFYLLVILALMAIAAVVLLVILITISKKLKSVGRYSLNRKIIETRRLQGNLENDWANKKISKEEYEQKQMQYHVKLTHLLDEVSALSRLLVDLDRDQAMLLAFEQALRNLKKQKKKNLLVEEDYMKNFGYYNKQIASLKKGISEKKKQIALAEHQAETQSKSRSAKQPVKNLPSSKQAVSKIKLVIPDPKLALPKPKSKKALLKPARQKKITGKPTFVYGKKSSKKPLPGTKKQASSKKKSKPKNKLRAS
ncbi:MAG: S16 family serine protease [archaeon]|jgi:predicted S18 family serine protease|nr:S16 family serine protease [archaeon]